MNENVQLRVFSSEIWIFLPHMQMSDDYGLIEAIVAACPGMHDKRDALYRVIPEISKILDGALGSIDAELEGRDLEVEAAILAAAVIVWNQKGIANIQYDENREKIALYLAGDSVITDSQECKSKSSVEIREVKDRAEQIAKLKGLRDARFRNIPREPDPIPDPEIPRDAIPTKPDYNIGTTRRLSRNVLYSLNTDRDVKVANSELEKLIDSFIWYKNHSDVFQYEKNLTQEKSNLHGKTDDVVLEKLQRLLKERTRGGGGQPRGGVWMSVLFGAALTAAAALSPR